MTTIFSETINLPRAINKITGRRSPVPLSILWRRVIFPRDRLCHSKCEILLWARGERVSPGTKVELSFARVARFIPSALWLDLRVLHDKTQDIGLDWHSRVRKWVCVSQHVCVDMFSVLEEGGDTAVPFAAGEVPPHPVLTESWQCRQNTGANYLPE